MDVLRFYKIQNQFFKKIFGNWSSRLTEDPFKVAKNIFLLRYK